VAGAKGGKRQKFVKNLQGQQHDNEPENKKGLAKHQKDQATKAKGANRKVETCQDPAGRCVGAKRLCHTCRVAPDGISDGECDRDVGDKG